MRISFKRFIVFAICLYGSRIALNYFLTESPFFGDQFHKERLKRELISYEVENSKNGHETVTNRHWTPEKIGDVNESTSISDSVQSYFVGEDKPDDVLRMKRPEYLKNYKNPCWYQKSKGGNSTLICLPYFRVIGVDKCGTTDLWYRLSKHPEIVRPKAVMGKETHWWSWRRFGFDIWVRNKPIRHFEWYLQHFEKPSALIEKQTVTNNGSLYHPLITGEGSPTEFWDFTGWNLIPQNEKRTPSNAITTPNCLHHLTPGLKSIVLVRNPTERAYSDYLFLDNFRPIPNLSAAGFHQDVIRSINMLKKCTVSNTLKYCLYSKDLHMKMPVRLIPGIYDFFLSNWLRVFPSDQILFLRSEDYSTDLKNHLQTIFQFLQLSPLSDIELSRISDLPRVFEKSARAKSVGPMLVHTQKILDDFYKRYNRMLATRLENDMYLWNS